MNEEILKDVIRNTRLKKGLTQKEVAESAGISKPYYSQIENGKRSFPSERVMEKIAQRLELDLSYLIHLSALEVYRQELTDDLITLYGNPDTIKLSLGNTKLSSDVEAITLHLTPGLFSKSSPESEKLYIYKTVKGWVVAPIDPASHRGKRIRDEERSQRISEANL